VAKKKRRMTKKQAAKTAALSKKMPRSLAKKIATNSKRRAS
jgi:hypothetical protein